MESQINIIDNNEITIKYKINHDVDSMKIFGNEFVQNNLNNCKIIINEEEFNLKERYNISSNDKEELEIKLKGINKITNFNSMFYGSCSLTNISEFIINNATDMSYMFYGCSSIVSLPDFSKWNTSNVTNMKYMFSDCFSLQYFKMEYF